MYPNLMFKEGDYRVFELKDKLVDEYLIAPGDELSIQIFSRDGLKLIDVLGRDNQQTNQSNRNAYLYLVDKDGYVNLPVLGSYFVSGLKETALEALLEQEFGQIINEPYAQVKVNNRRVFLFAGSSGSVVSLNNAPTNLFEVLAKSGGISSNLKAYKVKIIRGNLNAPMVYQVDLSSIQGLAQADLIMQSNDIIYLEPRKRFIRDGLGEFGIILSLISTAITSLTLVRSFTK